MRHRAFNGIFHRDDSVVCALLVDFLEHFGLKSLTDLPQIGEIKNMVERAVKRENLIEEGNGETKKETESAAE